MRENKSKPLRDRIAKAIKGESTPGIDPEIVREQIELLLKSFPVAAIKTGLLCNAEIVAQVARSLRFSVTGQFEIG